MKNAILITVTAFAVSICFIGLAALLKGYMLAGNLMMFSPFVWLIPFAIVNDKEEWIEEEEEFSSWKF